jgi:SAM-dependent methyltransferase
MNKSHVLRFVRKVWDKGFYILKEKNWFRKAANIFLGRGFRGISLGDTKGNFFRTGWQTVDIVNADVVCDLRTEGLPFADNSIDAFHSSHLIEHIADPTQLFNEVYRCLKSGGVFRISTPDMNLLVSKYKQGDWKWFLQTDGKFILDRITQGVIVPESLLIHNRLVGWLASYSGRLDTAGGPIIEKSVVDQKLATASNYEFRDWCVSRLESNRVYAHVHVYDFEELSSLLKHLGFKKIMKKRYGESDCIQMIDPSIDRKAHELYSMYIEAAK